VNKVVYITDKNNNKDGLFQYMEFSVRPKSWQVCVLYVTISWLF